jgi:hypothetical protein
MIKYKEICTIFFWNQSAQVICNLGDLIVQDLQECWPILVERLKNEITRLTAVKAICTIAE